MKAIPERTLKTVRCGYLYANGKLVLVHETKHDKAGSVEWVTIHDTAISCAFTGRIVLQRSGTVRIVIQSKRVEAHDLSISNGSDNTRARGLALGHVSLQVGPQSYNDYVYIPLVDGLAGDWTYQPANSWAALETPTRWAGYAVAV